MSLPMQRTALEVPWQLMVDKIAPAPRAKIRQVTGRIDKESLDRLTSAVAVVTGLLDGS